MIVKSACMCGRRRTTTEECCERRERRAGKQLRGAFTAAALCDDAERGRQYLFYTKCAKTLHTPQHTEVGPRSEAPTEGVARRPPFFNSPPPHSVVHTVCRPLSPAPCLFSSPRSLHLPPPLAGPFPPSTFSTTESSLSLLSPHSSLSIDRLRLVQRGLLHDAEEL